MMDFVYPQYRANRRDRCQQHVQLNLQSRYGIPLVTIPELPVTLDRNIHFTKKRLFNCDHIRDCGFNCISISNMIP